MKTVLITGSSKGLGKSLALVFADNRYNVILHGRDVTQLDKVKRSVERKNVKCDVVIGEITLPKTIDELFEIANSVKLDVLINNAGKYIRGSIIDIELDEIMRVLEVNLMAPILLVRRLLPIFQEKQSGLIVNINSMAGKNGANGETVYCASKHGLRGFSSSLQFEATENSVRILDVYSGAIDTDMTAGRADPEKLINPEEAAACIYQSCKDYPSLRKTEINLLRRNY